MITPGDMAARVWRIPLLVGCLIIPVILWLRRSLEETEAFREMRHHPRKATEVVRILATNWQIVLIGMMLTARKCVHWAI